MPTLLKTAAAALLIAVGFHAVPLAAPATAAESMKFSIRIASVTKSDTLKTPGAAAVRAPIALGVFVVSGQMNPIIATGKSAGTDGLETLAEDGNFEPLQRALEARFKDRSGMFLPGMEFEVTAKPGDRLSFAAMFVQSNDKFYAPKEGGVALFDGNGKPVSGNVTASVELFDAGTEADQQPGAGPDQAPRQKAAGQGVSRSGPVTMANDGFAYPMTSEVIEVTVTPES